MRITKSFIVISIAALSLCACSTNNQEDLSDPTPSSPSTTINGIPPRNNESDLSNEIEQNPDDLIPVDLPESGFVFSLNEEEEEYYEKLKESLSTDVLEGASPMNVAKIYIQCGIDGQWESEYALFAPDTVEKTKEEFKETHDIDISNYDIASRKIVADWTFPLIEDGIITVTDNTCTIEFEQISEDEDYKAPNCIFTLLKNDKDIWEVQFNPVVVAE